MPAGPNNASKMRGKLKGVAFGNTAMRAAILALAAFLLVACSSSQHATGPTTYTKTANGAQVEVLLDEYKIHMPTTIPPGEIILGADGGHFALETHAHEIAATIRKFLGRNLTQQTAAE